MPAPAPRCRLYLTGSPGAARTDIQRMEDGSIRARLAAPAKEGKANRELLAFLARELHLPPSHLTILRGEGSRHKVIEVDGLSEVEALRRLGLQ